MNPQLLNSLPLFLAHSLALELDSSVRLREFADMVAQHNQPSLSALFNELASLSDLHAAEVEAICSARNLPKLHPWEYYWPGNEPPETSSYEQVSYEMRPLQALQLMLRQEHAAADFYSQVAAETENPEIRQFAVEFAEEEQQHAHMLGRRLKQVQASQNPAPPAPDIDPPKNLD